MESKCADWEKQPKGSLVQAGGLMRRGSDVMPLKGVTVEELPEGFVVPLTGEPRGPLVSSSYLLTHTLL